MATLYSDKRYNGDGTCWWRIRVDYSGTSATVYADVGPSGWSIYLRFTTGTNTFQANAKVWYASDNGGTNNKLGTLTISETSSTTITQTCSGSTWGGTVNGASSVTIPAQIQTASFNLNILNPDGSEPYTTGEAGSVEQSVGGGSYSRVHNESASSYNIGTTFAYRNFTPGTGRHLSSVSGVSPSNTTGPWSATLSSSGLTVSFKTAWNTYSVAYNANGGSGAPSSQTKTYGTNLTLSSTKPTRTYYTFKGWSTSSTATSATYSAGATLSSDLTTTNGGTVTLYAVWEPNPPTNLSISRTGGGTTSIDVSVSATGLTMTNYTLYYRTNGSTGSYSSKSLGTSTTGTITGLSVDTDYQIYFTATNVGGTTTSGTVTYSTILGSPSLTDPVRSNTFPFMTTITATGSITPSRTLSYAFSKDGGSTWTSYQSSNSYHWTGLNESTTYSMGVRVKATHKGTNASDTTTTKYISVTTPTDQARIRIKKDGQWKKGRAFLKVNGEWKKADKIYIKVNGEWKENKNFYDNEPSLWD